MKMNQRIVKLRQEHHEVGGENPGIPDSTSLKTKGDSLKFYVDCPSHVTWEVRINDTVFCGTRDISSGKQFKIIAQLELSDTPEEDMGKMSVDIPYTKTTQGTVRV